MDLYERLRALKTESTVRPSAEQSRDVPRRRTDPSARLREGGWERVGDMVWSRIRRYEVEPLCEPSHEGGPPSEWFLLDAPPECLVYFDTETTGLSGGSGTMLFLVGLGTLSGSILEVEQVFLEDYPGEPGFLEYLGDRMNTEALFVSYNGKAFDTHVLATRHLMNGLSFAPPRQLDLLYPTRRLWKSLISSCSLGDIEARVLGVHREIDIPGYLIPDTYFEYLRSGDASGLEQVFEHHAEDIVSLHRLIVRIEEIARDPFRYEVDRFQLGRLLLDRSPAQGEAVLRRLAEVDDAAALELGFYLKRRVGADAACEVFQALYRRNGSPTAAIEVSKYLEHRAKDPARAREIVASLILRPDCVHLRESLRYRLARLDRKLGLS